MVNMRVEVVAALIHDKENRFLIAQRPADKARPNLWEFVGGKVEHGETHHQALIRECQEEIGITVRVEDPYMDVCHDYPDIRVHLFLYRAEIVGGILEKREHQDIRWITAEEILQYDFCPADTEILSRLQRESDSASPK